MIYLIKKQNNQQYNVTSKQLCNWNRFRNFILISNNSKLFTPSYVFFSDNERLIQDAAKRQATRNPKYKYLMSK
ncbi:unnamed protein product [Paramecium sonneborni]|uniref:Uncharacterized protein n=1 Tax=Paramecium sonneborni TaxID=65129 RepID=A0A8S1QQP7_9CILI|nr:unnamed protein product [Paramecium sonneborni]